MSEEETRLMDKFGITFETKSVFHYQGHKYERLDDAVKYAEKVEASSNTVKNE